MQSGGNTSHGRGRGSGEWHTSVYAAWKHVNYVNFPKTLHLGKWSLCWSLKKKTFPSLYWCFSLKFSLKNHMFFFPCGRTRTETYLSDIHVNTSVPQRSRECGGEDWLRGIQHLHWTLSSQQTYSNCFIQTCFTHENHRVTIHGIVATA